jgi:hypothetical protein
MEVDEDGQLTRPHDVRDDLLDDGHVRLGHPYILPDEPIPIAGSTPHQVRQKGFTSDRSRPVVAGDYAASQIHT